MHSARPGPMRGARIAAATLALAYCAHARPGPRLVCDEPVHDFGVVPNAESVDHTFLLCNEGDAPLTIDRVRSSCGCTTTRLGSKVVPAGGTVELAVKLSLRGRRGRQAKSIYVHSDDPVTPRYKLGIACTVRRDIEVEPAAVFFTYPADKDAVKSVRVVSRSGEPLRVTGVAKSGARFFDARIDGPDTGQAVDIRLKLLPGAIAGGSGRQGAVLLRTDHPSYPELAVPVRATVRRDVYMVPRQLNLVCSDDPNAVSPVRSILVRSRTGRAFEITAVTPPAPWIEAVTEEVAEGQFRVLLKGLDPCTDVPGRSVDIAVRDPDGEVHTLTVRVRVRNRK